MALKLWAVKISEVPTATMMDRDVEKESPGLWVIAVNAAVVDEGNTTLSS